MQGHCVLLTPCPILKRCVTCLTQTVPACWTWSPSSVSRRRCFILWSCSWRSATRTLCSCLRSCSRRWPTCARSSPTTSTSSSCWRRGRWTCVCTRFCRRSWRTCIEHGPGEKKVSASLREMWGCQKGWLKRDEDEWENHQIRRGSSMRTERTERRAVMKGLLNLDSF